MARAEEVLVVLGYTAFAENKKPVLGLAAEAVCQRAFELYDSQRERLFWTTGGVDHPSLTESNATGIVMRNRMVELGIPKENITVLSETEALAQCQPPLDTVGEIVSVLLHREWCGERGRIVIVRVLGVRQWIEGRVPRICAAIGIPVNLFRSVDVPAMPLSYKICEPILDALTWRDPLGKRFPTNLILGAIRAKRRKILSCKTRRERIPLVP
jgi:hypothetical protein